jgi:hypothetical protein
MMILHLSIVWWPDPPPASVGWLAGVAWVCFFYRLLLLLHPGTHRASRWWFTGILALGAPVLLHSVLHRPMAVVEWAVLTATLYYGLRAREWMRPTAILGFVSSGVLALSLNRWLLVVLVPFAIGLLTAWWQRHRPLPAVRLLAALLVAWGGLALGQELTLQYREMQYASAWGLVLSFPLYVPDTPVRWLQAFFYPLLHPGFCLLLPGLLLLFKKTDLYSPSRQTLLVCGLCWCAALAGRPQMGLSDLWPAYMLLLLLLFPAWDRFFAYGSYFFKKLTIGLLTLGILCQILGAFFM